MTHINTSIGMAVAWRTAFIILTNFRLRRLLLTGRSISLFSVDVPLVRQALYYSYLPIPFVPADCAGSYSSGYAEGREEKTAAVKAVITAAVFGWHFAQEDPSCP
ncbi:MAG: hypothetical protein Q4B96_01805 [Bacillota bacterium]|nr:hypothetical protein [Bacillota bacterium]